MIDITCPKCGAANRKTSRFCARCGEVLEAGEASGQQNGQELNLSWLEAVQDRAVKETGQLDAHKLADEVEAERVAHTSQAPVQAEPQARPEAQAGEPALEALAEEHGPGEGAPDEPPPEWVVGILEPKTATSPNPEQAYEPEEMAHIMPWMGAAPAAPSEEPVPGAEAKGLPPWLGDVTVQETLQARSSDTEQKAPDDMLFDLEGLEPFAPPDAEEQGKQGSQGAGGKGKGRSKNAEQVPEWLKTLAPSPEEEEVEEQPAFEHFTPVTKVILDPKDTLAEPITRSTPVRPPRPGSVETLAALVQMPAGAGLWPKQQAGARSVEAREFGLRKWLLPDGLIYLAVLAVLLAVLALKLPFGALSAPAAPDTLEFFKAVEAAPSDKPVLLVYDWDASLSAEMSTLAGAVTNHLMARHLRFVTVSTIPQGPGFAQQITAAAAADTRANYGYVYGRDYLVLGYVPGGEAALGSLTSNISTLMPLDYVKSQKLESFELMRNGNLNSLKDFSLVVDLTSDEAALRNWIEQASTRTGIPIIAAVPQGLEPMARPYRGIAGPGLKAVLSGQAGASQYLKQLTDTQRITTSQYSADELSTKLNAQLVAQLLVTLAIVGAFVSLGLSKTLGGGRKT
jgi:hypothetical protein